MCVLIFSTISIWNIFHFKKKSARYHKCTLVFRVKHPLFLLDVNQTLIFLDSFSKNNEVYNISWKSVQWEASCSVRTDRRSEMKKLTFAFRNFAEVTKKCRQDYSISEVLFSNDNFVTHFYSVGIFYEIMQPKRYKFIDHKRSQYLSCPISYRNFVTVLKTIL